MNMILAVLILVKTSIYPNTINYYILYKLKYLDYIAYLLVYFLQCKYRFMIFL